MNTANQETTRKFHMGDTRSAESQYGHFFRTLKIRTYEKRFEQFIKQFMLDCGEAMLNKEMSKTITITKFNYDKYFDTNATWMKRDTENAFLENLEKIKSHLNEFMHFAGEYYNLHFEKRLMCSEGASDYSMIITVSWYGQKMSNKQNYQISINGV